MTADPPGQDPKTLWQDQEQETDPVTLEQIHRLSRRLDRDLRWTPVILGLVLLFVGFVAANIADGLLDRVAAACLVVSTATGCFMAYRTAFPPRDPAEPAIAYIRKRLQRRLSMQQGGWALPLLPLLPGALIAVYEALNNHHDPLWLRVGPFLFSGGVLVYAVVSGRKDARETRVQLQEFDDLLKR
jgi:hypothetical protein